MKKPWIHSLWSGLFLSAILVLLAALFRAEFLNGLGTNSPFLTFHPAIFTSALFGGLPAGFLATVILLVEDEQSILNMTQKMLERLGYSVLAASLPGEAIHLANRHQGEIHLLMTDVVMPEMNGRDLAKNILALYPNLKRLFMSGYTANVIAHHGVLDQGVNFIQKPFSMQNLAAKLKEVLGGE